MKTRRKEIRRYSVLDKTNRPRLIIVWQEISYVGTIHDDQLQEVAGIEEHRLMNGDLVNVRDDGTVEHARSGEVWHLS